MCLRCKVIWAVKRWQRGDEEVDMMEVDKDDDDHDDHDEGDEDDEDEDES